MGGGFLFGCSLFGVRRRMCVVSYLLIGDCCNVMFVVDVVCCAFIAVCGLLIVMCCLLWVFSVRIVCCLLVAALRV